MEVLNWVQLHWPTVLEVLGYLYLAASVVVALTPTPADDAWLARLSFLAPRDARGTLKVPGTKPKLEGEQ